MTGMGRAVHAEWTKLRTVRSTAWLVLGVVAFTVALGAATTASVDTSHCPTPSRCHEDITKLVLTGARLGQVAVVVLAALAMTDEYSSRMIETTLLANPRRGTVLASKAAVLVPAVLAAGTVGVLASLTIGRMMLPGNGFTAANGYAPLSLADGSTLRAAAGTVLYLGLVALLSLGVGTIIRDSAGAITSVLALLFVVPVIGGVLVDSQWQERLEKFAPMPAGLAIQATTGLDRLPIGPWAGLGVLAAYATASLLLGALVFAVRDA